MTGMERVLENWSWLIRFIPLILNIWMPNTTLKKEEITLVLAWVKLRNVAIVAYSETGLSLITTKLGRPIMLDTYTSDTCLYPWGRNKYSRALIEVSASNALLDSLVVAIPLPNGKGHTLETIEIEYEWKPPRCETCKIFDHIDSRCPKKVEAISVAKMSCTKSSTNGVNDDGFVEVQNRKKKKGKEAAWSFGVIKLLKSKTNIQWQQKKINGSKKGTNSDRVSSASDKPLTNLFDVLNMVMEDPGPSIKIPKVSEHNINGSSKTYYELNDDYHSPGGGSFSVEDDVLDCFDGYEAQVYKLSGKS